MVKLQSRSLSPAPLIECSVVAIVLCRGRQRLDKQFAGIRFARADAAHYEDETEKEPSQTVRINVAGIRGVYDARYK